ncbi:MAG TPA: hypothetical protein VM580_29930 [Labilithrix sp.]|nr:hypothetical protein [Labilithrix sp.]
MSPLDALVFRDTRQLAHGGSLLRALERSIAEIRRLRSPGGRRRAAIEALISSGELEAALADAGDPLEETVAQTTDALAAAALGEAIDLAVCADGLAHARAPRSLAIRPPKGFAYYALHPEAYARASELVSTRDALVIGVRSIGTTLSAVTAAALRARGVKAWRETVRPETSSSHAGQFLCADAADSVQRACITNAAVVIVDGGTTAVSSHALAVAEAAVRFGVPHERVLIIGGHPLGSERCGTPGGTQLRSFRIAVAPSDAFGPVRSRNLGTIRDVSRGEWRRLHYSSESAWPAVVAGLERRKMLAGGRLFKFEGLGAAGQAARHRASALAAEGIALDPYDEGDGWASYAWCGRPLARNDLEIGLIEHIARYCARRPSLCPPVSAESDLEPIVARNVELLLGHLPAPAIAEGALTIERIATPDGRLEPHEWLRLNDGSVRKTDAIAHGDDDLFPGPTDIAWDLAGAIIEWEMDRAMRAHFLTAYRRASGDDATNRIDAWIVAYAAVRGALSLFALETASPSESPRLAREVMRYRSVLAGP